MLRVSTLFFCRGCFRWIIMASPDEFAGIFQALYQVLGPHDFIAACFHWGLSCPWCFQLLLERGHDVNVRSSDFSKQKKYTKNPRKWDVFLGISWFRLILVERLFSLATRSQVLMEVSIFFHKLVYDNQVGRYPTSSYSRVTSGLHLRWWRPMASRDSDFWLDGKGRGFQLGGINWDYVLINGCFWWPLV